ncbi:MAG TPA: FAD-binding protein [Acidimicrobiales bacterium]|nr:FAD-binding protein [Acidimicrobiales bacterium]
MTRMNLSNVLVIGSGAAGLRAAIAAHEAGAEVLVIGKRPRLDAHTVLASGGINAAFVADAVVLCAGGHTRLWRRSSSRRDENYGEGMALALEAGCRLMDMELVQFHPTGMVAPEEAAGTLVTEAVRGEGGRLTNAEGERFMARYDSDRMELSTRDRVALANYTEISEGRGGPHGGVFLDISHLEKETILSKLPRMYRQFIEYQMVDISMEPMEVAPTGHYSMGGVVVNPSIGDTVTVRVGDNIVKMRIVGRGVLPALSGGDIAGLGEGARSGESGLRDT